MRIAASLVSQWLRVDQQWDIEGVGVVGDLEDESSGAERLPDSLVVGDRLGDDRTATVRGYKAELSFPTEAKVRQKQKQKQLQEQTGSKVEPKRKKNIVE